MKEKPFSAGQFTATRWHSVEEKAQWANAMAAWIQRGFPENGWRKGLYEPLSNMYGHIAHYNQQGFYQEWFQDNYRRLDWLKYVARGGVLGIGGDPHFTWSDVERAFKAWVKSSGLVAQYEEQCAQETEKRERALLAELQAKYSDEIHTTPPPSDQKGSISWAKAQQTWADREPQPAFLPFELSADLVASMGEAEIAFEVISASFGISADGIEQIVERLQRMMRGQEVTNGHVLAVLLGEISAREEVQV